MEAVPNNGLEKEIAQDLKDVTLDTQGQSPESDLRESVADPEDLSLRHSVFGPNIYGDFYS